MVRKHGWDWPLHGFQVAAIAVFFSLMAMFYIFLAPFLGSNFFQYAAFASYSVLATTVILLYIRCAAINPGDPGAIASQAQKDNEKNRCMRIPLPFLYIGGLFVWFLKDDRCLRKGSENFGADEDILFCTLCNTEVRKFSKHCRTCDKCVDGFDHHCRWLNNCVGRKNYTTFFALMTASLILLIMEWAIGAAVIARCFANNGATKHQIVNKLGNGFPIAAFATIVAVSTAVALVGSIPLLELLFFHLILIRKGLTTYDYVVAMRTQNEEQPKPPQEDVSTSPNNPYQYKGAWCTPPREFVKHGDEITPHLELGEISPLGVDTTATSKLDNKSIKINPCNLAKLNPIQVARAVSKARKKSSVMRALNRDNALEAGRVSTNNHTKTKSEDYDMLKEFDSSKDSEECCALPAKADYDQSQGPLRLPSHK